MPKSRGHQKKNKNRKKGTPASIYSIEIPQEQQYVQTHSTNKSSGDGVHPANYRVASAPATIELHIPSSRTDGNRFSRLATRDRQLERPNPTVTASSGGECDDMESSASREEDMASRVIHISSKTANKIASSNSTPSAKNVSQKHNNGPYKFPVLLVLDFEATCEEYDRRWPHEIIEFPVVAIDTRQRKVIGEFHSYVRPTLCPQLTNFCKQLTGIKQEIVDAAPTLPEVIQQFEAWLPTVVYSYLPKPLDTNAPELPSPSDVLQSICCFATDGPYDLRDFMHFHSVQRAGIYFPPLFYRWVNVRTAFASFYRTNPIGIRKMLFRQGDEFVGTPHSGIDDARNLARVVIQMLKSGDRAKIALSKTQKLNFDPDEATRVRQKQMK